MPAVNIDVIVGRHQVYDPVEQLGDQRFEKMRIVFRVETISPQSRGVHEEL